MANINLLPWRQELRKERQKEFFMVIGLVVAAALFILYSLNGYYASAIENQNQRNNFITSETQVLNAKIKEIQQLRETRQMLIERMELIQALQGNRPIIVRVFDEVARAVPDDLYFTDISIKGTNVLVKGVAKSNNRVSALMRNFDRSDWFTNPALVKVHSKSDSEKIFEVTLTRDKPQADEE